MVGATVMPTVKRGGAEATVDERPLDSEIDPYLSTTARLTADAPFHVVSDGTYVVVLRQSIGDPHPDAVYKLTDGGCSANASRTDYVLSGTKKVPLVPDTLPCDRFLLVDGKLKPVLEVRYKRSRHATRPASAKDTLGTEDMEGRPFHEPTQELSFVRNLTRGRFAAVLVPTAVSSARRWQLFAHNDATGRIDSFSVEQGVQGLFNTQGTRFYTSPDPLYRDAVFERSPGTCPFTNQDLVPVTSTDGHAETALGLTGANDAHVDLGDPAALRFGGKAYSIEAWIKPTAYDRPLLSRGGEYRLGLDAGGALRLAHEGAATAVVSTDTVPKDVYTRRPCHERLHRAVRPRRTHRRPAAEGSRHARAGRPCRAGVVRSQGAAARRLRTGRAAARRGRPHGRRRRPRTRGQTARGRRLFAECVMGHADDCLARVLRGTCSASGTGPVRCGH